MSDADQILSVVVLCADWCSTCRAFRPLIEAFRVSGYCIDWIDIEDHDEALQTIDIDTFPTVIVADRSHAVYFAGPIEPHIPNLERLLNSLRAGRVRQPLLDHQWRPVLDKLLSAAALKPC
jgi:thioredoxin 1